ncbi:MAG: hypothetical protein ACYTF1_27325 [Planctomycetota bacterium]
MPTKNGVGIIIPRMVYDQVLCMEVEATIHDWLDASVRPHSPNKQAAAVKNGPSGRHWRLWMYQREW